MSSIASPIIAPGTISTAHNTTSRTRRPILEASLGG